MAEPTLKQREAAATLMRELSDRGFGVIAGTADGVEPFVVVVQLCAPGELCAARSFSYRELPTGDALVPYVLSRFTASS